MSTPNQSSPVADTPRRAANRRLGGVLALVAVVIFLITLFSPH